MPAYFECEGRKSIEITARSQTSADILLQNILTDRDIHELVYERKNDVLMVAGLEPKETKELVIFLSQNKGKEINIYGN